MKPLLDTNLFTQLTKNKEKFKLNVVTEKQNGFIVLIIPDLQLSSYGDTEEEAKEMLEACLLDYIKTIFKLEYKSKYINPLKIEWKKQSSKTNLEIVITLLEKKLINKEDETVYLLNNPNNAKFLKESIKEIEQGETVRYKLSDLNKSEEINCAVSAGLNAPREDWEEASKVMNQNEDDTLLIDDNFSDDDLNEWTWEEKA